jgi:hypothetical protein
MKRNNLETLFGVKNTPGQDQIKHLADDIEPAEPEAVFEDAHAVAEDQSGKLKGLKPMFPGREWNGRNHPG